jgi:CheY-like chemotaxis protein
MPSPRASVLLIEDDDEVGLLLSAVLTEFGYQVCRAEDGMVALAMISAQIPDIILCDLNLPKIPGPELLEMVRRNYPNILLIAMSGAFSQGVPPGVIADAFYEKGKAPGSLLQILAAVRPDAPARQTAAEDSKIAS